MTKKSYGKPLTEAQAKELIQKLVSRDLYLAERLSDLQEKSFPARLKNISEWVEAEKCKRVILGLADKVDVNHSGNVTIEIVDYSK